MPIKNNQMLNAATIGNKKDTSPKIKIFFDFFLSFLKHLAFLAFI